MQNLLACDDLVVAYGSFVAADRVSFTVDAGEIFGLLGPNGAGKTSMIRALTTILAPRSGSATIAGVALTDQGRIREIIGVLPESSGYPKTQTGPSYLRFFGQLFGLEADIAEHRADRLLTQFGLGGNNQRIGTYSRGMRQRLGICRALINDPVVLFLDEPTLGLDPAGKEEILANLAARASERATAVVLCTHLLDEVERVCDRVAIMDDGKLIIQGRIDEVIDAASLTQRAKLRVAASDVSAASDLLKSLSAVDRLDFDNTRPGDIEVRFHGPISPNLVLGALVEHGINVVSYDISHGSLSEAFLALTDPARATRANGSDAVASSEPRDEVAAC